MDKYIKVRKIGQGSFGCAYLATRKPAPGDNSDRHGPTATRQYVIKEIRMDPRDRATAMREARLLAALDHPNIISCRESFTPSPNVLCIVTEYADGGDLRQALQSRIQSARHFTESELLDLLTQICLALKHLHDRKILHRDIKPENVFLTQARVVKLGDFGVAAVLAHTMACAQTQTGTPYYTSPEICRGARYNGKTDVWSLGCLLYELATFQHAFTGRSQRQLFENIMAGRFVAMVPRATGSGDGGDGRYGERFVALVHEMLRLTPRERPSINQIIRRPLILERIQGFLSERALADELNHTVLHGHNIFRKPRTNQPTPLLPPPPPPPSLPKKHSAAIASPSRVAGAADHRSDVIRRAEAVLLRNRAKQTPAASPAPRSVPRPTPMPPPAPAVAPRLGDQRLAPRPRQDASANRQKEAAQGNQNAMPVKKRNGGRVGVGVGVNVRKLAPTSPRRLVQQPKAKEKQTPPQPQKALRVRGSNVNGTAGGLSVDQRRLLQPKKETGTRAGGDVARPLKDKVKPMAGVRREGAKFHKKAPVPPVTRAPMSDRIAAFNVQWDGQRQRLLQQLGSSSLPVTPPSSLPPPPPPLSTIAAVVVESSRAVNSKASDNVVGPVPLRHGLKKESAVALEAARRREAMRRDIQARKKALAKPATPLDDPVILVQNLPNFDSDGIIGNEKRRGDQPQSDRDVGSKTEHTTVAVSPPPAPIIVSPPSPQWIDDEDDNEAEQEIVTGGDEKLDSLSEPTTPQSSDERSNLEFQRMLLQLQGVLDGPGELENEENEEDDDDPQLDQTHTQTTGHTGKSIDEESMLPPPYDCGEIPTTTNGVAKVEAASDLVPPLAWLPCEILEQEAFRAVLRARLRDSDSAVGTVLPPSLSGHQNILEWLEQYVNSVIRS